MDMVKDTRIFLKRRMDMVTNVFENRGTVMDMDTKILKNRGTAMDMDTNFLKNRGMVMDMVTASNRCPPNSERHDLT